MQPTWVAKQHCHPTCKTLATLLQPSILLFWFNLMIKHFAVLHGCPQRQWLLKLGKVSTKHSVHNATNLSCQPTVSHNMFRACNSSSTKHLAVLHGCSQRQCLLKLGKVTAKHRVHNATNLSCQPTVSHNMLNACNTSSTKHLAVLHGCSQRQWLLKLGKVTTKHSVHNATNLSCQPALSHNMLNACNTSSTKHLAVLHGCPQRQCLLKLGKVTTKHSVHNATNLSCQTALSHNMFHACNSGSIKQLAVLHGCSQRQWLLNLGKVTAKHRVHNATNLSCQPTVSHNMFHAWNSSSPKHLAVLHGCPQRQWLLKLGKVTTKHSVHNATNLSCQTALSHNMLNACNTSSTKHLAVLHGCPQRQCLLKLGRVTVKHRAAQCNQLELPTNSVTHHVSRLQL